MSKQKQAQRLPVDAKTLNALANMIKRKQYKPTEEDIPAIARFIIDRKHEGDSPHHLFFVLAKRGHREFADKILEEIREIAPDEAVEWEDFLSIYPDLYREACKQIIVALEKKWNTNIKKAGKDIRKQVLANLKKKWELD